MDLFPFPWIFYNRYNGLCIDRISILKPLLKEEPDKKKFSPACRSKNEAVISLLFCQFRS
jgi:hypothetical protein